MHFNRVSRPRENPALNPRQTKLKWLETLNESLDKDRRNHFRSCERKHLALMSNPGTRTHMCYGDPYMEFCKQNALDLQTRVMEGSFAAVTGRLFGYQG